MSWETADSRLLCRLFDAYFEARRNKRNTHNQLRFELNFETRLAELYHEIVGRTYRVSPGIAFVIKEPVKREILAADFRDRVVHHLLFSLINPVFNERFIAESFSCRKGKGTMYGIKTLDRAIRACSEGYREDCYVLKLDIAGYFMNIDKGILRGILHREIETADELSPDDKSLSLYLIDTVLADDPTKNCRIRGCRSDWDDLPTSKSLFHSAPDCGLPIGNLTSQLFSNIYLNQFDHYVKEDLGMAYYGRYVDDFYIVHRNPDSLRALVPVLRQYLREHLGLLLHPRKIFLQHYGKGVNFLGATLKPYRRYVSNRTKNNFLKKVQAWEECLRDTEPDKHTLHRLRASLNSYLGIMQHFRTYNIRRKVLLLNQSKAYLKYGYLESVKHRYMFYYLKKQYH
jgi:RNA-directed DNA polymerase